jgi:uncharacterized repeat protein (TIGR01451 family)
MYMNRITLKKRLLILVIATLTIATLFPGAVWAHNSWHSTQPFNNPNPPPITEPPAPELLWVQNVEGDVTDLAVGDLNGDNKEDVAALDFQRETLNVLDGEGDGAGSGKVDWSKDISGFSVAVGDIDGDHLNEVVANNSGAGFFAYGIDGFDNSIVAYENNGSGNGANQPKWQYDTLGEVKDIEIGDVDGDGIKDVIACNNFSVPGTIYVINGVTGEDLTDDWPVTYPDEEFMDVAVGQLDGISGMDIAAIGRGVTGSLFAFDKSGGELWSKPISGPTVEIGDVNGDGFNEVVAGTDDGYVRVYAGADGTPLYSFNAGSPVTDVELGDLDGNKGNGLEVACICSGSPVPDTLYALDIDNSPGSQVMWYYDISWDSQFYGESLAIGDVDRDYKNEVIAAGQNQIELDSVGEFQFNTSSSVYAFDGLDNNHDGIGDLVWSPYEVDSPITDLEIGDLDGDGDQDVVFGTLSSEPTSSQGLTFSQPQLGSVYAITAADPNIVDPKTVTLEKDADGNGVPSPGDTLKYTAVINNTGTGAATGVTFSDTPDANTTLVAGSVTTSQGSVSKGNSAGDKWVGVSLGVIPPAGTATITFEVTINNPLHVHQIANQAITTGTNFSAVKSDDPGTPQPGDPTIIDVQASPLDHVPGIPGISFWGGVALILLLGGAMIWVIRRRQIQTAIH